MKVGAIEVPEPDDDPALLASLYSGYAFSEHWRHVVLSACKEIIRASASLAKQHLSEARIQDLAYTHPAYLEFLATHLQGRRKWEKEVIAQGGFR